MELVAIITVLALMQFVFFGIRVGQMRGKHGVKAPDMTGDPEFMRMFRWRSAEPDMFYVAVDRQRKYDPKNDDI